MVSVISHHFLIVALSFSTAVVAAPVVKRPAKNVCPSTNKVNHALSESTPDASAGRLYCFYTLPSKDWVDANGHEKRDPYSTSCVYDIDSGRFLDFIKLSTTNTALCLPKAEAYFPPLPAPIPKAHREHLNNQVYWK